MSLEAIIEKINEQAGNIAPIGSTVKFKLDDMIIHIDGTGDTKSSCPECKAEESLMYKEGCLVCKECGYSKCG